MEDKKLRWLGQKSCRTKVSRLFRIFVPDFALKFAPNFPPIFSRIFRALYRGKRRRKRKNKKIFKNPRHFSRQNSQANTKQKNSQNVSGEHPTVPEGHKHRVTTPGKPRKIPRTCAGGPQNFGETLHSPLRDPAEPSERPPQSPCMLPVQPGLAKCPEQSAMPGPDGLHAQARLPIAVGIQSRVAIAAAIYRSALGPWPESAPPTECFLGNFGHLPRSAPKSAS